jgi:hypothetical protein
MADTPGVPGLEDGREAARDAVRDDAPVEGFRERLAPPGCVEVRGVKAPPLIDMRRSVPSLFRASWTAFWLSSGLTGSWEGSDMLMMIEAELLSDD